VAQRVHQGVAALVDGDVELAGYQHLRTVVHAERLPVFGGESETRHAPDHALSVDAHRELEVFVDCAEKLPGVDHLDGLLLQPEIVAQRQHATHVDAGHERAAEIHRNPVRLPMTEGAKYALSAACFRHVLLASRLTVSRRGDMSWMMLKPTR